MTYSTIPVTPERSSRAGLFVSPLRRLLMVSGVIGLALPTAIVAIGEGAGGLPLPFNLHLVDQRLPVVFKLHMLASGLALLLIPLVIWLRRESRWHKPLGRVAATAVLAGALTSLPVAAFSNSVGMARAGFFAQGVVWLVLIALGYRAIRERRVGCHGKLMVSMAAVASGAIWVRLATAAAVSSELPFDAVYGAVAWLGWLVPLALVQLATGPANAGPGNGRSLG